MKQSELDAIRARLSQATPGPWYDVENDMLGGRNILTANVAPSEIDWENTDITTIADLVAPENGPFLAASWQDVTDLLAEVDRLRTIAAPYIDLERLINAEAA